MTEEVLLKTATEYFYPFPDPETVFAVEAGRHTELFLPLCTLDLSHFNKDWKGLCPVVSTVEPCVEGLFGEHASEHHTYYCRDNWIGFELIENRLRYLGDWRLFTDNENQSYYRAVFEGFERAKTHYKKMGYLGPYTFRDENGEWEKEERAVELAWVGGKSVEGNWAHTTNFPFKNNGSEAFPLTEDGRLFEYLCGIDVSAFIYGDNEAEWAMGCTLIVFYDPKEHIILTTFEWT